MGLTRSLEEDLQYSVRTLLKLLLDFQAQVQSSKKLHIQKNSQVLGYLFSNDEWL